MRKVLYVMSIMLMLTASPAHAEAVNAIDSSIVARMEQLKSENDELADYVDGMEENYGKEFEIDLTEESEMETVPLLIQWDKRWGYKEYGSGLIGYTGCGPTCLSMVALYFTNNPEYSPAYMADFAMNKGYYVWGSGTAWDLFEKGAKEFGLVSKNVSFSEESIKEHLDAGELLVCSMKPGDFTQFGHFIVVKSYNDKGFRVNDPNSKIRSKKTWAPDVFVPQVKQMWSFRLDEKE